MYLEDSVVGQEVWRESFMPMLQRVSDSFPAVLQEESQRDGPICYITVKVQMKRASGIPIKDSHYKTIVTLFPTCEHSWLQVCLQVFQLLPNEVAPLVWEENHSKEAVQRILQALIDILGQVCFLSKQIYRLLDDKQVLKAAYVSCCAVLQQGHASFGGHSSGDADQHCIREYSRWSCSLESAAGLSSTYVTPAASYPLNLSYSGI